MFNIKTTAIAVAGAFTAMTASVPAAAVITTIAQFNQLNSSKIVSFTNGTGALKSIGTPLVNFVFLDPSLPAALASQNAFFSFASAVSGPAVALSSTTYFQPVGAGTISFTRQTPYLGLTNLLTISFSDAALTAVGTSGTFFSSTPGSTVTFSSDFMTFGTNADFALSFSAVRPAASVGANGSLKSFTANATGTFAADVPEPRTWALLTIGFGLVGLSVRRRKARVVAA